MVSGRPSASPIIRTTIPSPYPSDWFVIMLISKKHKPGKQLKSISIKDSEAVNGFTMTIIIKKHKAIFLEIVCVRISSIADNTRYIDSDVYKIRLNILVICYFPFRQCLHMLPSCVCGE